MVLTYLPLERIGDEAGTDRSSNTDSLTNTNQQQGMGAMGL